MSQKRDIDSASTKLCELLSQYTACIDYAPLENEVDAREYIPSSLVQRVYTVPANNSCDPVEEAKKAMAIVGDAPTCVLLPGTRFDRNGMRLGRGGGWYDRFLAHLPRTWLRVGFCFTQQLSESPLFQEKWDQRVAVVCVSDPLSKQLEIIHADKQDSA